MPGRRRSPWCSSSPPSPSCCSSTAWHCVVGRCDRRADEAHEPMRPRYLTEPRAVRWALTGVALAFLVLFLFLPLVVVFTEALEKGIGGYLTAVRDPVATAAIRLTLLVAAIVVPLNAV